MSGNISASPTVLTVGVGEEYSTISAAIAASSNGDVIKVNAGTYTNDFATISNKITLEAVGGVVNMVATEPLPNEKGILVVDNDATIQGFAFSGAEIPASEGNNGAGIRYQAGNLTLLNDDFTHNQDGLLATPEIAGTGTIDIENSEFAYNGAGDGFSHNIYVGNVASFTFNNSYSHDAVVGHEIKSRAEVTTITNSRIEDGNGTASYTIDLPNGGKAVIENDVIQQGANSQNPAIIAVGEEGNLYANSSLLVSGNTIVNDLTAHVPVGVFNPNGVATTLAGNKVYGLTAAQLTSGPATVSGTTFLTAPPVLDTSSHWQPTTVPGPTVLGSGPDTLVLEVSEDAWKGNAEFTVSVDGKQIGGTQTAVALHAAGQSQAFDVEGTFGAGKHTVTVDFLNDAWGGTASTDRNLYVTGATIDGIPVAGASLALYSNGPKSFTFQEPTTPAVAAASTTPAGIAFIGGGSTAGASSGSHAAVLPTVPGDALGLPAGGGLDAVLPDPGFTASLGGVGADSNLAGSARDIGQALAAGRYDYQANGSSALLSATPPMHDLSASIGSYPFG
jgi:Ca-dependent carbohydrate-binding module xylan-binding